MVLRFIEKPIPAAGVLQEVSSGIFWLRMPLPFDLDHINLCLLEDNQDGEEGFALIDTGIEPNKPKTSRGRY